MAHETTPKKCAQEGCDQTFKPHYWGSVKAHDKGWFHQKDGNSWCPGHNPPWVEEWRKRQGK
jgi:hypothetical protein